MYSRELKKQILFLFSIIVIFLNFLSTKPSYFVITPPAHANLRSKIKVLVEYELSKYLPVQFFIITSKQQSQLTFTCSKLTIETLEQGVKYVQS